MFESSMTTALPKNIVAGLRSAGVSLIRNEDRTIRCNVTAHTARSLLGLPFQQGLLDLLGDEEEDEEPDIDEHMLRLSGRLSDQGQDERDRRRVPSLSQ
jgi:hypothetical protein